MPSPGALGSLTSGSLFAFGFLCKWGGPLYTPGVRRGPEGLFAPEVWAAWWGEGL